MPEPVTRRRGPRASPEDGRGAPARAALLLAIVLPCGGCALAGGVARDRGSTVDWGEVVTQRPGPEVSDAIMRRRIEESGRPWKVRDRTTGIEMVLVLPGEFLMGSPLTEAGHKPNEGPQHRVRLTRAFYLGATEVTQAQWLRVMGSNPAFFRGDERRPLESVTWNEIQTFLDKANAGVPSASAPLRLPTEAEWAYACRAGTDGPFHFAEPISHALVNHCDGVARSARVVEGRLEVEWITPPAKACRMATAPAGSLPPNAWGLHEMHGNVLELCEDRYAPDAYVNRAPMVEDPIVRSAEHDLRSLRGGSWYDSPLGCRAAARDAAAAAVARSNRIGFRVARTF